MSSMKTDLGKILQAWISPMVARLVSLKSLKYKDVNTSIVAYIKQEWLRQLQERKREITRELHRNNEDRSELLGELDRLRIEQGELSK